MYYVHVHLLLYPRLIFTLPTEMLMKMCAGMVFGMDLWEMVPAPVKIALYGPASLQLRKGELPSSKIVVQLFYCKKTLLPVIQIWLSCVSI